MKIKTLLFIFVFGSIVAAMRGAETFDEAVQRASLDYANRLRQASAELTATRDKIAQEKAPALKKMRAAEDRIISADEETTRLETVEAQAQEHRRRLVKEAELLRKNVSYLATLAQDGLKALDDELAPGENQALAGPISDLQRQLGDPANATIAKSAADTAGFLLARVQQSLGGYAVPGNATIDDDNQVVKGVFAFMGPETYFKTDQKDLIGTVGQLREGGTYPLVRLLPAWTPGAAAELFQGKPAMVLADSTTGKALRLKQTQGTIWQHVQKGGVVAYAIIAVGFISLLLILQKSQDLSRMAVDKPNTVQVFLGQMINDGPAAAKQKLAGLKTSTRELFGAGLRAFGEPKVVLEERLQAIILRERLHYERRLPLLAVIATAAPLMGLLGTVIGMVRTFALITVFGTGNAGKLASGISEVLVTTELGLLVAIPTLVAHGILSQRIQKNLSLLERYALEFVTATQTETASDKETVIR